LIATQLLLLVLASAVPLGSESHGTQDHILLSQFLRLPQPEGPGPCIYIPQEQGHPDMSPGTGFPFCRLLRLAGLQWRYSIPPPHGINEYGGKFTQYSEYVTTAIVTQRDCLCKCDIYFLSLDTFTVTQAVNAFGFGRFQVKLSLFTGLCWMADSMEMTILSILSPALHCEWHITRYQQALTTTVSVLNSVNIVDVNRLGKTHEIKHLFSCSSVYTTFSKWVALIIHS
jgi:hypothetical protein